MENNMITKANEPIYQRKDGSYVLKHGYCDYGVNVGDEDCLYPYSDIKAYLAIHPEALVDEPVPPPPSPEQLANNIRLQRDNLLRQNIDCYNAIRWESMSETDKQLVRVYRQKLLDITKQKTFPKSVIWPTL